jgi:hypothetical protein
MHDPSEPRRDEQRFGHASLVPRDGRQPRLSRDARMAMILRDLRSSLRALRTATRLLEVPQAGTVASENAQLLIKHELGQMSRFIDDLIEASRTSNFVRYRTDARQATGSLPS